MGLFTRKKLNTPTRSELTDKLLMYLIGATPVVFYNYDTEDYVAKGYGQNLDVYRIIKKITDKANTAAGYLYIDSEATKSNKSRRQITKSLKRNPTVQNIAKARMQVRKELTFADEKTDLALLFERPNYSQTWRELITLFRIFYFVQGEAFMYRESGDDNCAISLQVVPAHLMTPILNDGDITGWRLDMFNGKYRTFDAKDILHFKMPNPIFDSNAGHLRGISPLAVGLKYLQLDDKALEGWIKSIENEGAKGIVSPNHADPNLWLTPDQVTATQSIMEEKIHGTSNRNKIAVSGMPLQYTSIGLSPDALNIVKGLEHAGQQLCTLWGISPVLFESNPTYENQKIASEKFLLDVIIPYLNNEEDKLNSWLVEPFIRRDKKAYVYDYDLSAFEELRLSADDIEAMLKVHTINEVRAMIGDDEIEEDYANQVFIQSGMIPLSDYSVDAGL